MSVRAFIASDCIWVVIGCSIIPSFQANKVGVEPRPSSSIIHHPNLSSKSQDLNPDGGHVCVKRFMIGHIDDTDDNALYPAYLGGGGE